MMCYINRFWKGVFRRLYQQLLHLIAFFLVGLGQLYAENWKRDNLVGERLEHIGGFSADTLETKYGFVRFEQGKGRYGFDLGAEKWYQKTTILDAFYKPFGKGYIAPWKLIPVGDQDEVIAKYEGRSISNLRAVYFASAPNSTSMPAEFDERTRTWKLTLPATDANSSYDVFAIYEGKVIGKLRVVSYPQQSYRVRLVPVNGQSIGDISRLSQNLNDIYNQYGVSFTLYAGEGMQAQLSPSTLKAELKNLNKQYQQGHTLTSEEVCIFVLSDALSQGSKYEEVEGLMERGKRFGYIFAGNSPNEDKLARTLAHELGHGLFTLRHTSAATYGRSSGRPTANLMDDQPQGIELAAYQWNIMASPAPFTGFDRDKDAQLSSDLSCVVRISRDISDKILRSGKAILSAGGDKIQLPSHAVISGLFYRDRSEHPAPLGSIAKFRLEGLEYRPYYSATTSKFTHYKAGRDNPYHLEPSSLPLLDIQIDDANHRVTIEGEVFQLEVSDFICLEPESKTFSGQHFHITQAIQEKISFATKDLGKDQTALEELVDKFVQLVQDFDGGGAYLGEVIADKLLVYQKRNGGKFVVVTGDADLITLNQKSWNAFAQEVFQRSDLGNRDILITIPRARAQALLTDGVELHMVGLAYGSRVFIDTSKLSSDYDPTQKLARALAGGKPSDVIAFVMDVFTHTKKKVVTHRGYFTPSRSITIITDTHGGADVSGYPYNEAIIPYVQKRTDELVSLVQARASQYELRGRIVGGGNPVPHGLEVETIENDFAQRYIPLFAELAREGQDLTNYQPYAVTLPIHYREGCISEKNSQGIENYKAYLLQYAYDELLQELDASTRGGFSFVQEHAFTNKTDWYLGRYVDRPIYATLDGASVLLGFVGFDFVPDALNLFYSIARGDQFNALLAGSSIWLVGPASLSSVKYADEVAEGIEATARIMRANVDHAQLKGLDHRQILEAQEVLTRAGHTRLAMQADALRIVIELRAHRNLKAFGLSDELLGSIASTVNTEGYAQIVANLRTFIDKFAPQRVEGLGKLVRALGDEQSSFREGAEWTLRYLANHADEFTSASKLSFEVAEQLKLGKRTADMVVRTSKGRVYYEFKSVKNLPPGDFLDQFSKDLSRPDFSIDNLRWVFDGRKIKAEDLERLKPTLRTIIQDNSIDKLGLSDDDFVQVLLEIIFIIN